LTDIGTVLGGRYRLVELLGQGGMATIYRARDNQLERDVAVKILRPEYGADPDFIDRFRHEAQAAASLNHPGIVAVHDYGTDPAGPYIVMELIEGEDLATIVRRTGALPPRAAARLVAQAARAIAAAHDRGFVHRDVKPGNLLVTREGRVKVTDFGIARALSESALTLPGTTLGSVHYFSPEQARGELATPASDIYSLGIVLFELLTGRRPWTGDTAAAIATARLTGAVPSPSAAHGGIPPTLEAITRKALAPNPEERYGSAAEMAGALEAFVGEERGAEGARAGAAGALGAAGVAGAAIGATTAGAAGATGAAAGAAGAAAVAGAAAAAGNAPGSASPPTIAGVARPNPEARIDYPRDAYAAAPPRPRTAGSDRGRPPDDADDEPRSGAGPWLWISALLAIAVLALAAFLVTRFLGGAPTESPGAQVTVPNLIGKTFDQARAAAAELGLNVDQIGFEQSSANVGTVTKQDPPEGTTVDSGSTVSLTIAIGPELTIVPDLRLKAESDALNLIAQAGLAIGTRTEAFDSVVPAASIISQAPGSGQSVARGTAVDYVVSKGPEPTPTPAPTPVPTPPPPPPTQDVRNVGDYQCQLLALAQSEIGNDSFTVGTINGPTTPEAWVIWQDPQPGAKQAPGSAIDLWTVDQPAPTTCPIPQ
jgi:serine/threonine-protein kinase